MKFWLLWFLPILAIAETDLTVSEKLAASGAGNGGNADIYSGGDPRLARLELSRGRLSATLAYFSNKKDLAACSAARCDSGRSPALCRLVESMTADEKSSCDKFLRAKAAEIKATMKSGFVLSANPLKMSDGRTVAAFTNRTGNIVLHDSSVDGMNDDELMALLFHEYAHKISTVVLDDKPVNGFARGDRLLDASGAAVAFLAAVAILPSQEPPPMSKESWKAFCKAAEPEKTGMLADVASVFPKLSSSLGPRPAFAREVLKHSTSRLRWLRSAFRKYLHREILPEEETFFLERFHQGEGLDSVLASLVGTPEYDSSESASGFAGKFFVDFVGRPATVEELKHAADDLKKYDRPSWALAAFKSSKEAQERVVREWYRDYLNRAPSAGEINGETSRIAAGETWEEAQARLLAGDEYAGLQRKRFALCK